MVLGGVSHFHVGATIAFRAYYSGLLTAVVVANLATPAGAIAAFGILVGLQITHFGLVRLFFAHITFLQLSFWFWVVAVISTLARQSHSALIAWDY